MILTKKCCKSADRYTRTQASACFILSIQDTLIGDHSISEQYVTETKLFKGGSGVGTNFRLCVRKTKNFPAEAFPPES
jgi:ribonucleoside-diphosphate reductase alpha chain